MLATQVRKTRFVSGFLQSVSWSMESANDVVTWVALIPSAILQYLCGFCEQNVDTVRMMYFGCTGLDKVNVRKDFSKYPW